MSYCTDLLGIKNKVRYGVHFSPLSTTETPSVGALIKNPLIKKFNIRHAIHYVLNK